VAQFIFPGIVSLFSPLYVGFMALVLAIIAVARRKAWFWGGVALVALVWSFGANAALYPLLYNLLPGLRYFRGQERGAYLVANSLAVLAGMGAAYVATRDPMREYAFALRTRNALNRVFGATFAFAALIFALWIGNSTGYNPIIGRIAFGTVMVSAVYLLLPTLMVREQRRIVFWIIPLVIAVELFTINLNAASNYDARPPDQQLSMTPPPLIAQVRADTDTPFRVDGARGVLANYGSLYGIADIHGISPLWLSGAYALIEGDMPDPISWELFAVRYVFTDWAELPLPSQIVGTGTDAYGAINLHRLDDPRPFALILNRALVAENDDHAYALLRDPNFDARGTLILNAPIAVTLTDSDSIPAEVFDFTPESFTVRGASSAAAILSVALPHHPGWRAELDGHALDIVRAYGGLSAIVVPAGAWAIRFSFDPLSVRIGGIVSIITSIALIGFGGFAWLRSIRSKRGSRGLTAVSTPSSSG